MLAPQHKRQRTYGCKEKKKCFIVELQGSSQQQYRCKIKSKSFKSKLVMHTTIEAWVYMEVSEFTFEYL